MSVSASCEFCTGEIAEECRKNFSDIKKALDSGAEATLEGAWKEVIIESDGNESFEKLQTLEPSSGLALDAQKQLHDLLMYGFVRSQQNLGCRLSAGQMYLKLNTQ